MHFSVSHGVALSLHPGEHAYDAEMLKLVKDHPKWKKGVAEKLIVVGGEVKEEAPAKPAEAPAADAAPLDEADAEGVEEEDVSAEDESASEE